MISPMCIFVLHLIAVSLRVGSGYLQLCFQELVIFGQPTADYPYTIQAAAAWGYGRFLGVPLGGSLSSMGICLWMHRQVLYNEKNKITTYIQAKQPDNLIPLFLNDKELNYF